MALEIKCDGCGRIDIATSDVGPILQGWQVREGRRTCGRCTDYERTQRPHLDDERDPPPVDGGSL